MSAKKNVPVYSGEEDLSNVEWRREVIKEIVYSEENRERKAQALRRDEILKSNSKKWVMFSIEQEGFKQNTVEQMRSRATNLSVAKKIFWKLSQTYTGGVDRTIGEQKTDANGEHVPSPDQVSFDLLYDELDFNTKMKKADLYRNGFRNCLAGVVPVLNSYESGLAGKQLFDLQMQVLSPWKYDVIEDPNDKTKSAVVIISEFTDRLRFQRFESSVPQADGVRTAQSLSTYFSDGIDSVLADDPADAQQEQSSRRFIWWSGKYHFTTDIKGVIIPSASPADNLNPIKRMPWETIATDQDGSYWARGGDDIFETDLLINKKLTDVNFISFIQGWGQLVIDAINPPTKIEGGPDNAFIFARERDQAPATVFFASSNPNIDAWLETVRMLLALCLSTNDLSTRNIAAKLDVVSAPSAVSLMVENSELIADVKDSQEYFRDKEPCLFQIATAWHTLYKNNSWLTKPFQDIEPIKQTDVNCKFHEVRPPISEKESLEVLQMRKDLGISTTVDLLKRDNPDLTDEEALKKADEIHAEKEKMASFVADQATKGQTSGIKNGDKTNQGADGKAGDTQPNSERQAPSYP